MCFYGGPFFFFFGLSCHLHNFKWNNTFVTELSNYLLQNLGFNRFWGKGDVSIGVSFQNITWASKFHDLFVLVKSENNAMFGSALVELCWYATLNSIAGFRTLKCCWTMELHTNCKTKTTRTNFSSPRIKLFLIFVNRRNESAKLSRKYPRVQLWGSQFDYRSVLLLKKFTPWQCQIEGISIYILRVLRNVSETFPTHIFILLPVKDG